MKLGEKETLELIEAAADEHTDVLITPSVFPSGNEIIAFVSSLNVKTVLLFPCVPVLPDNYDVCVFSSGVFRGNKSAPILIAGANAVTDDEFTGFISKNRFCELVVLFAECALPFLYGHCRGFGLIGELRASLPFYMHLTAVFAENISGCENIFLRLFGCKNAVSMGKKQRVTVVPCDTLTQKATFFRTADECEKYMTVKKAVFFPTRRHAEEFSAFMLRRGISCPVFHGGKSAEEMRAAAGIFAQSSNGIIAATKSFIPTALFLLPFRPLFCGMPPDIRLLEQISVGDENKDGIFCVYSSEDIKTALRIRNAQAALFPENEQRLFLRVRTHSLEKMIDILNE